MTFAKRILIVLLAVLIPHIPVASAGPSLVFDSDTGEVLIADDAGVSWHPASLTKMLTAYITFQALRAKQVSLEQKITMSEYASKQPPSKIGVAAGKQITIDFALRALLVYSANDMAMALAEAIGGSQAGFADRMNKTAQSMGMTGSFFVNPNGLNNAQQIVTARDLGLLIIRLKQDFPEYAYFFSTPSLKVGKRTLKNRNGLLRELPGVVDGMKTGFICASGYNLAASGNFNGRHLVAIVMGSTAVPIRNKLTRMLLEEGAKLGHSNIKLKDIGNQAPNPAHTKDISDLACGKKARVNWGNSELLSGWGSTLGTYKTSYEADAVMQLDKLLTGNVLSNVSMGVYRLPGTKNYVPIIWGLTEKSATSICGYLSTRNRPCEVQKPETIDHWKQKFIAAKKAKRAKKKRAKKKSN